MKNRHKRICKNFKLLIAIDVYIFDVGGVKVWMKTPFSVNYIIIKNRDDYVGFLSTRFRDVKWETKSVS